MLNKYSVLLVVLVVATSKLFGAAANKQFDPAIVQLREKAMIEQDIHNTNASIEKLKSTIGGKKEKATLTLEEKERTALAEDLNVLTKRLSQSETKLATHLAEWWRAYADENGEYWQNAADESERRCHETADNFQKELDKWKQKYKKLEKQLQDTIGKLNKEAAQPKK